MRQRVRFSLVSVSTLACVVGLTAPSLAAQGGRHANPIRGAAAREQAAHSIQRGASSFSADFAGGGTDDDAMDEAEQYANERSLPADNVSGQALVAAHREAAALPHTSKQWTQVTTKAYNAAPSAYRDPIWSNYGSGFGLVAGRTTALAAHGKYWYAGAADGGVWRSADQGKHWTPIFDTESTLSIGALSINPSDGSLWVGTGEANTSADSYNGTGVYVSHNHGGSFKRVGGSSLTSALTFKIAFDGAGGVYAATSTGLYKTTANGTGAWKLVLQPDAGQNDPPYNNQITTVAVRPGTGGRSVLAVTGWRNGSSYNGFYLSKNAGKSFTKISPSGDIDDSDIGRTTLAYSADGSKLYALVESPTELLADAASNLMGVYVSATGNPAGPYTLIADKTKLENSGSALTPENSPGYEVGIQSWYNQVLVVDPYNANRLYVGLEEGFETSNGGRTFTTASPYWNYGLACGDSCPQTTHPDQHAAMFVNHKIVIGNDGGVYSRPLADAGYGNWSDLNATYHNLQYYDAQAGALPQGGTGYWGGLQDNGTALLATNKGQEIEPAGGDGGDVIVDPKNANRMVGEYTDQAMYSTTDGGKHYLSMAPSCYGQEIAGYEPRANCDPESAFIAPMTTDSHNINNWVTGGQYIWTSKAGWNTKCDPTDCTWEPRHNLGDGNYATALAESGNTLYAAWVGGNGEPGPDFARGIVSNVGGHWHQLNMTGLPNRFPAGVTIDPKNPNRVYAVFNGYTRRWIPGGGEGVVFVSNDGGKHWTNISGNLPDAPGDALVVAGKRLALATDVGVFTATAANDTHWIQLGTNLPHTSVNDLRLAPGNVLVAATHGRGIWTYALS